MKKMLLIGLILCPCYLFAWQGDVTHFTFLDGVFTLDAPAIADTTYLSTACQVAVDAIWEAVVHLQYAPSSSNLARIYLMADTACLTAPLQGYFVQVGGAKKNIALYRQDAATPVLLLASPDEILSVAPVQVALRVHRSDAFLWQLEYALDNGPWLQTDGMQDATYTQNQAWGIWCKYTKTRNQAFAFANLLATGDTCVIPQLSPIERLYITELLYDPFPGGVDFVELYNASDVLVRLERCELSNGKKSVKLPPYELLPYSYVAVTPSDSLLLSQYPDACSGHFLQVSALPNFVNDSGRVCLQCEGVVLDSMVYSDKMHHAQISDTEGFSLERVPVDGANWFSASSDAMATPGCENSQSTRLPDASDAAPLDKTFWLSDSWFAPYQQYLSIAHSLPAGCIANAWVYNLQGVLVRRLYNNALLSASGQTYWDGLNDDNEPCSVGIYVVVIEYVTPSADTHRIKLPVALVENM